MFISQEKSAIQSSIIVDDSFLLDEQIIDNEVIQSLQLIQSSKNKELQSLISFGIQSKSEIKKDYISLPIINKQTAKNISQQKSKLFTQKFSTSNFAYSKEVKANSIKNLNFRPLKSIQIPKKSEVPIEDYLPAFIKNFKLPPKQKPIIIPTMSTFRTRQALIEHHLSPIQQLKKYQILSPLGRGSFSQVVLAIDKKNNKKFAIKIYQKMDQIDLSKFQNISREIDNLLKLKHRNIVKLYHVVQDKRKIFLILQNCGQQSLAGLIRKKKILEESLIKSYFRQIVQGISYCHSNDICHRDLKLENILVDQQNNLKIIDFGFSLSEYKHLNSFCGTLPYMAPQITLKSLYNGKESDIWSLGIILYVMVYGKFPFRSKSQPELFRLIQQGKITHQDQTNPEIKQIINKMLKIKPNERITAEQILQCRWLQN